MIFQEHKTLTSNKNDDENPCALTTKPEPFLQNESLLP